jgi:hypothetical protein
MFIDLEHAMKPLQYPFNLNDISREPTDEQLETLMEAVAVEARRHAQLARDKLLLQLRAEINAVISPRISI